LTAWEAISPRGDQDHLTLGRKDRLAGQFEWGLGFDWQILQAAIDRDQSTLERLVATLYDSAGDDHIN
jgi:hypothetical protein